MEWFIALVPSVILVVCNTNLVGFLSSPCGPTSFFFCLFIGQFVKDIMVSLVFYKRARHDGFRKPFLFPLIDFHVNLNFEI